MILKGMKRKFSTLLMFPHFHSCNTPVSRLFYRKKKKNTRIVFNLNAIILDALISQLKYLEALFVSTMQISQFFNSYQLHTFSLCCCILIYVISYQIMNIYFIDNIFFYYHKQYYKHLCMSVSEFTHDFFFFKGRTNECVSFLVLTTTVKLFFQNLSKFTLLLKVYVFYFFLYTLTNI